MTEHLCISFEYDNKDITQLCREIEEYIKIRCLDNIPHNKLICFRIMILSKGDNVISIEPFFGSSSFISFLQNRKKSQYANIALIEIIECLQLISDNIKISFYFAGLEHQVEVDEEIHTINEIIALKEIPYQSKFLIKTPQIFFISQVEFELEKPLEFEDNNAIGYFCNYYIYADDINQALEYIINEIELGTFVGYGNIGNIHPVSLPSKLKESFDLHEKGIFYRSGKIFFGTE